MKDAVDFVKNNKRVKVVLIIVVVLALFLVVLMFFIGKSSAAMNLKGSLEDMGKDFYENYYYDQVNKTFGDKAVEFLEKYQTLGIKVDLDNLGRYNDSVNSEKIKAFVNPKNDEECDSKETKAIIYPTSPFGRKDYKIEVELACGLDD